MKKWLIRCLTVLAMVCLIPGIALNAKAAEETVPVFCARCETMNERESSDTKNMIRPVIGFM